MIITLAVSGYRSLRDLVLPLAPLTVVTGANGTGKSSLYRALRLLGEVSQGGAVASLAAEGGLLRPLGTAELSDGTLRYLLLAAALLTPRPPGLMVLNEPETSLHPDLILPLARLISEAATRGQVVVVSHDRTLADALTGDGVLTHRLTKDTGETVVPEAEPSRWTWPKR